MTVLTENEGLITQIIGPVIDVEFQPGQLPEIFDALDIYTQDGTKVVAEVQQLLGENKVRSVAMSSTDGLQRGMKVINTKAPISIPVGKETLGRILNVLGEPVDEMGEINTENRLPIHRPSPKLVDQNTNVEIFETGEHWEGTARVHGAGKHIKTQAVSYQTTIAYPNKDDNARYTRRGMLRKDLREWLAKNFSSLSSIPKEAVVLNPSESCLSFEGFAKKENGKWMVTPNAYNATNFVSYKLFVYEKEGHKAVGHDELSYPFKEDTLGYVSSVDVSDGF